MSGKTACSCFFKKVLLYCKGKRRACKIFCLGCRNNMAGHVIGTMFLDLSRLGGKVPTAEQTLCSNPTVNNLKSTSVRFQS